MKIHPSAIIDANAQIADDVEIGPYAVVDSDVKIGSGCKIGAHAMIHQYTEIGSDCQIFPFASVGSIPQDLKFKGEKTVLKVGRKTVIREFATLNRGTGEGGGITEVGDNNLLMSYTHVAHDCKTGNNVIMSNNATLAGHVIVGDYVILGGFAAVHQFVHLGSHCYIGGKSAIVKDVPPFVIASGDRAVLHGLNKIGLERRGYSQEALSLLKKAYKIMFRLDLTVNDALEKIKNEVQLTPEVDQFLSFIENASRGITR
ncbi:MAG: acyl-ACP--UDP-N-acetylglucosamine O-acyltransferase [Desulforegulaceae bacterium]|nr:acyl-ACP--UDP-N-acetylglucosamine O-acyltransferase [Desulforegulaceae bacterium]